MGTAKLMAVQLDGGTRAWFVGIIGSGDVAYARLESGSSANYINAQVNGVSLSANTLYHIVKTYDGSKANTGLNVYVNTSQAAIARSTGGTYNGITTSGASVITDVPRNDAAYGYGLYQVFRIFNAELTSGEVTTLYNSGTPVGLTASLQAKCIQENLFEGNLNADNIGTNGSAVGSPTFAAN